MRLPILILLIVASCWCKTLPQYSAQSSWKIDDNGLLVTTTGDTAVISLEERLDTGSKEVLFLVVDDLNGGSISLTFAESTQRTLRWTVTENADGKVDVQLCVNSVSTCYSSKTLDFSPSDLTVQVEAVVESAKYLRFWVILANTAADDNPTPENSVKLSQVLRLDDNTVLGDWTLDLQPVDQNLPVSVSALMVVDRETKRMDTLLLSYHDITCLDSDQYIGLYQYITEGGDLPNVDNFQPGLCDPVPIEAPWVTGSTTCDDADTGFDASEMKGYFDCGMTGTVADENPMPAFCFHDVTGNFIFQVDVVSALPDVKIGAFVLPDKTELGNDFVGIWSTKDDLEVRHKTNGGNVGSVNDIDKGLGISPSATDTVTLRVERKGDSFKANYDFNGVTSEYQFDWTNANMAGALDCCVIYRNSKATVKTATFANPQVILTQD